MSLCLRAVTGGPVPTDTTRWLGPPGPEAQSLLERAVFERVPGHGRWGTAFLLDGNLDGKSTATWSGARRSPPPRLPASPADGGSHSWTVGDP